MRIDERRKALRNEPFHPFQVRVADGREYRADHPEFMAVAPNGSIVVVFDPEGFAEWVDTIMITSLHLGNGKTRRKKRT